MSDPKNLVPVRIDLYKSERGKFSITHGLSSRVINGSVHPLYAMYTRMKRSKEGICTEWEDNNNFFNWALNVWEEGTVIRLIDKDFPYSPHNIKWVPFSYQQHGFSKDENGSKHPLYGVYGGIKQRCYNPKHKAYKWYGGRGIKICDEWRLDKSKFYQWMMENGWEKGLQLDRIDNDGPYSPENCRIVTSKENHRNKSDNKILTAFGVTAPFIDLIERFGVLSRSGVVKRLSLGWDLETALSKLPKKKEETILGKLGEAFGEKGSLDYLFQKYGNSTKAAFRARINSGWDLEKALTYDKGNR